MLDATERLYHELVELINNEHYYVIHAARQVGKTTLLLDLTKKSTKRANITRFIVRWKMRMESLIPKKE